jgi:hypothetical protein
MIDKLLFGKDGLRGEDINVNHSTIQYHEKIKDAYLFFCIGVDLYTIIFMGRYANAPFACRGAIPERSRRQ